MKRFFVIILFWSSFLYGEGKKSKKIITEHKKYEFLDLGKLEVEGGFSAPTDILIEEQKKTTVRQKLYDRKDYFKEIKADVMDLK